MVLQELACRVEWSTLAWGRQDVPPRPSATLPHALHTPSERHLAARRLHRIALLWRAVEEQQLILGRTVVSGALQASWLRRRASRRRV